MSTFLIKNAKIVNEGNVFEGDVLIENDIITEKYTLIYKGRLKSYAAKLLNKIGMPNMTSLLLTIQI
jgi:dihydroorotase-like cyclic amidohydrolase